MFKFAPGWRSLLAAALLPTLLCFSPSAGVHAAGSKLNDNTVAAVWFPGWGKYSPQDMKWKELNVAHYAFATTKQDGNLSLADSMGSPTYIMDFVSLAHSNGVKALITVGGWTGSRYFSSMVSTASARKDFIQKVLDLVNKNDFDGVDFDWEYPNKQGIGCNIVSPDDTPNFLSFLQELRNEPSGLGKRMMITAAAVTPWLGPDGNPADMSQFADVVDYIEIMNYDVHGSWSATVGANAPLADACSPDHEGSAATFVNQWTAAGMPAHKLVLGVASYGHSFYVASADALQNGKLVTGPPFEKNLQPAGPGETTGPQAPDECGNTTSIPGGIFTYEQMIEVGFLDQSGSPAQGISSAYDSCSQTPFVYNATDHVMISYDNAQSFGAKGKFINDNGLLGFAMWDASGDSHQGTLVRAISAAMQIQAC